MKLIFARVAFLLLVLLGFAASGFAQARLAPAGWATHNDPKGFAMDAPPGWNFATDARSGRIVVQGPQGEQVVIWPASIAQALPPPPSWLAQPRIWRSLPALPAPSPRLAQLA